jgi:hypothetical protein
MRQSSIGFIIKCNIARLVYLYWNGVTWTSGVERARVMPSKKDAEKELRQISPPRFFDKKGEFGPIGPHVFEL